MTSFHTYKDALLWAQKSLLAANQPSTHALKISRLILSKLLNLDPEDLITFPQKKIEPSIFSLFKTLIQKASLGVPLSRLLNEREFWSLPFKLNSWTLDPRPDSETLIETALALLKKTSRLDSPLKILDLGTGSGCLLLSLLSELPSAFGIGVDLKLEALRVAQENSKILSLFQRTGFIQSFWADALKGSFDVIISNPPYIKSSVIPELDANVRLYDPLLALDGGKDGLACYQYLIPQTRKLLSSTGLFLLEIGYDQAYEIEDLLRFSGFQNIKVHLDLESRPRVVSCTL